MNIERLFVDDSTRRDKRARINTEKLGRVGDITTEQLRIEATGDSLITVFAGSVIALDSGAFFNIDTDNVIGTLQLDTGDAFEVGRDYYIYLCDPGYITEGGQLIISLNSTFPTGWKMENSRKIGGFHFGVCRRVNTTLQPVNVAGAVRGANWEANVFNGIVARSVWTLSHRPKCSPEGMVYLAGGKWVDIYLSSDDGAGGLISRHNTTPITGTEGLNCYSFVDRMLVSGKRLLTYSEFIQAAFGSPQGLTGSNLNAHTAGTARALTGSVERAVSSVGCRDCVGNVWEWLDEFVTRYDATGVGAIGAFSWRDVLGEGNGQAHLNAANQLIALIAGGNWGIGVNAGARAVNASNVPWHVSTNFGSRGACDSL